MASKRSQDISATLSRKTPLKKRKGPLSSIQEKSSPLSVVIAKYASKDEIQEVLPELKRMKLDQLVMRAWRLKDPTMCEQFLGYVEGRIAFPHDHRVRKVDWKSAATFANVYDLPSKGVLPSSLEDESIQKYFQGADSGKKDGYFLRECQNDKLRKLLRVLNPVFSPERWQQVQKKTVAAVVKAWLFPETEIDWAGFLCGKFGKLARSSDSKTYRCFLSPYLFHSYQKYGILSWGEEDYLKWAEEEYHRIASKGSAPHIQLGIEQRRAPLATNGTPSGDAAHRMPQHDHGHDCASYSESGDEHQDVDEPNRGPTIVVDLTRIDTPLANMNSLEGNSSHVRSREKNLVDVSTGSLQQRTSTESLLALVNFGESSTVSKKVQQRGDSHVLPQLAGHLRELHETLQAEHGTTLDLSERSEISRQSWRPGILPHPPGGIFIDSPQQSTDSERRRILPHPSSGLLSRLKETETRDGGGVAAEEPTDLTAPLMTEDLIGSGTSQRSHGEISVFVKNLYAVTDGIIDAAKQLRAKATTWMQAEHLKDAQVESRARHVIQELQAEVTQKEAEITYLKNNNSLFTKQFENERSKRLHDEAQWVDVKKNLNQQIESLMGKQVEKLGKLLDNRE